MSECTMSECTMSEKDRIMRIVYNTTKYKYVHNNILKQINNCPNTSYLSQVGESQVVTCVKVIIRYNKLLRIAKSKVKPYLVGIDKHTYAPELNKVVLINGTNRCTLSIHDLHGELALRQGKISDNLYLSIMLSNRAINKINTQLNLNIKVD